MILKNSILKRMSVNTEIPPELTYEGPINKHESRVRPLPPTKTKLCDVPYCDKTCEATIMFDNTNITCMKCNKFHCNDCSAQIWKGEWNGNVFYKPNLNFLGLTHEVFQCAFCRATFDRMY